MADTTKKYVILIEATDNVSKILKRIEANAATTGKQIETIVTKPLGPTRDLTSGLGKLNKQITTMAKKAAVALPVWLAMRAAFQGTIQAVRDGLRYLVEFDKGLAKALAVTDGVKNLKEFETQLKNVSRALTINTGASAKEVTDAFYEFGTSGLDAATALAGMDVALKTSIALMGDSGATAKSLADIYKLLGNTIEGANSPTEKFQIISGTLVTLWKKNAFTLKEFTDGMQKLGGVAATLNLTFDQTAVLIATTNDAAQRGATAGTQLSRAFSQMIKNIDKVDDVLGRTVKLTKENAFDVFEETAIAISKIEAPLVAADKAFEIFGQKSTRAVLGLIEVMPKLKANMESLQNTKGMDRFATSLEEYKRQMETIERQLLRTKAISNVAFEAFVTAATDSADLASAIKKLNDDFLTVIPNLIKLGALINFVAGGFVTLAKSIQAVQDIQKGGFKIGENLSQLVKDIKAGLTVDFNDIKKAITDSFKDVDLNVIDLSGFDIIGEIEKIEQALDNFNVDKVANIEVSLTAEKLEEDVEKLQKKMNDALEPSAEDIGNNFAKGLTSSISNALQGKDDNLLGTIGEQLKVLFADNVAEGLVKGISKSGVFKILGKGASGLQNMFSTPAEKISDGMLEAGDAVARKFYTSITGAFDASGEKTGDGQAGSSTAAVSGLVSALTGGSSGLNGSAGSVSQIAKSTGLMDKAMGGIKYLGSAADKLTGGILSKAVGGIGSMFNGNAGTGLAVAGLIIKGATNAYRQVQEQGGKETWSNALLRSPANLGALASGNMWQVGYQTLGKTNEEKKEIVRNTFDPLEIVSKKTRYSTSISTQEESFQVASRIDITNKRLEMIGRDLTAIRDAVGGYVLPESTYFSETQISEKFNIDSKRTSQ